MECANKKYGGWANICILLSSAYFILYDMSVEILIPASVKSTGISLHTAVADQQSADVNFPSGTKQRKPFNSISLHPDNTIFATASDCLIFFSL